MEMRPMPLSTILFFLKSKSEAYLIDELRKNYTNDILYAITSLVNNAVGNSKLDIKIWGNVYQELKGTLIEDERTAKEIEEDTLNLFKREE